MTKPHDRNLGMSREITRRDFLNGVAITLTGSAAAGRWARPVGAEPLLAGAQAADYYPPTLTGMRGSHAGSFEVAHALSDGRTWDSGPDTDTGERYDLVVVGGGISGLSAAWFFRAAAGPAARILILDNHDDFGGHAKRNEFSYEGQTLLINGGTLNIEAPGQYSAEAAALLREIGIDRERFRAARDRDRGRPRGLGRAFFFDHETFGEDRLVPGYGRLPWSGFAEKAPLSAAARRDLVRLNDDASDFETMPELHSDAKKARLARISYRDYLIDVLGLDSRVADFYQSRPHGLFCVGIDAIPALFCWEMGYPGFQGMALEPTPPERLINEPGGQHGRENGARASEGGPSLRFADGNATITRLLVSDLIPEAIEASSMEDVVMADLYYDRLDVAGADVRIRLNSTAVHVAHRGDPADSSEVEVTYVRDGKAQTVRAAGCVMACYNSVIPHLCPELPAAQKEALAYAVKAPIVYTNVLLRDWSAFQELGGEQHRGAGCLPHEPQPRFPDATRRLPAGAHAAGPGPAAHGADAQQPRLAEEAAAYRGQTRPPLWRPSRRLSATSAATSAECCRAAVSTRHATSWRSRSTAGRTVTRTPTTASTIRSAGPSTPPDGQAQRLSVASASAASPSPTPTPRPAPTLTRRSTRPTAPCRSCCREKPYFPGEPARGRVRHSGQVFVHYLVENPFAHRHMLGRR